MSSIVIQNFQRLKTFLSHHLGVISAIVLVLLNVLIYFKLQGHEFIITWDDGAYVAENQDIRGLTFKNLTSIFTTSYMGNYAPIHLFSYMLEFSFWGDVRPPQLLAANVALHAGSTLLFYRILVRSGLTVPQSIIAAALFAAHPVQVESVAWISQRKNTLAMLLFLSSWLSWIHWNDSQTEAKNRKALWYGASLLFFALALLTKSIAVILPLFLIAQECVLERRAITAKWLKAIVPYIVLSLVCFLGAFYSQQQGSGRIGYFGGSMAVTLMNMLPVYSRYLILLFIPSGLSIIYNSPIKTVPDINIILSGFVFILFLIGWVRLWKPHRSHFFWLTIFVVGLLPVSGIIPIVTMMNDRYLYFPMLGMAPFMVLSIDGAFDRCKRDITFVKWIITIVAVVCFSLVSRSRVAVWKDPLTLFADTIAKVPEGVWYGYNANFVNYVYADTLVVKARERVASNNWGEAHKLYLLALSYDKTNYYALLELSTEYLKRKQSGLAYPYLVRLGESYKRSADPFFLMGAYYERVGNFERSRQELQKALAINPQHEGAIKGLKLVESRMRGL